MEQRNAFTLIELLIVVAIIGILAAIAIPNFLNAQIRARVAKAESDLQAQATAVESYRLDQNFYPPVSNCGFAPHPIRWSGGMALIPLTTPVAYMATLPKDPFNEDGMATSAGKGQMNPYGVYWYMDRRTRTGGTCDTTSVEMHFISNAHLWAMKSAGPDRDESIDPNFTSGQRGFVHVIYMMSNGLRSNGDVYRYGP